MVTLPVNKFPFTTPEGLLHGNNGPTLECDESDPHPISFTPSLISSFHLHVAVVCECLVQFLDWNFLAPISPRDFTTAKPLLKV